MVSASSSRRRPDRSVAVPGGRRPRRPLAWAATALVASTLAVAAMAGVVGPPGPLGPSPAAADDPTPVPSITDCTVTLTPSTIEPGQTSTFSITSTSGVGGAFGLEAPVEFVDIPFSAEITWEQAYGGWGAGPTTIRIWALNLVLPPGPLDMVCEGTLVVGDPAAPSFISPPTLPGAVVGEPVTVPLLTDPGSAGITLGGCQVTGTLPPGLTLADSPDTDPVGCGVVTGTPTEAGTFTFTATISYEVDNQFCGASEVSVCGLGLDEDPPPLTVTRTFTMVVSEPGVAAALTPRFTG